MKTKQLKQKIFKSMGSYEFFQIVFWIFLKLTSKRD